MKNTKKQTYSINQTTESLEELTDDEMRSVVGGAKQPRPIGLLTSVAELLGGSHD